MKIAVIDDSAEDRKLLAEKIQNFCLRESLIYEIRSFLQEMNFCWLHVRTGISFSWIFS